LSARKKWLGDTTLFVHRIEAENAAKIGEKEHFVPYNLWSKEQTSGKQRLNRKMRLHIRSNKSFGNCQKPGRQVEEELVYQSFQESLLTWTRCPQLTRERLKCRCGAHTSLVTEG